MTEREWDVQALDRWDQARADERRLRDEALAREAEQIDLLVEAVKAQRRG